MKTRLFCFFMLTFLSFNLSINRAIAQNNIEEPNGDFAYLYNQQLVTGDDVILKTPLLKSPYFIIDKERIPANNVKFYKNRDGFFANTYSINHRNIFAERVKEGNINLYEYIDVNHSAPMMNPTTGAFTGGGTTRRELHYYNQGWDNLKKVNYDNLHLDLITNAEAMVALKKYRNVNQTSIGVTVAGCVLIASGLISFVNKAQNAPLGPGNEPDFTTELSLVFGGLGVSGIGYVIGLGKKQHLYDAIDIFNR